MNFKNKIVVITGASSGIGYATTLAFAKLGAIPVAVARRETQLQTLIAECQHHSPQASYLVGDLGIQSFAENVIH